MSIPSQEPRVRQVQKQRAIKTKSAQSTQSERDFPPSWAGIAVFQNAHVVAWEGTTAPLQAISIFPPSGTFLDAVSFTHRRRMIAWEDSVHPLDTGRVRKQFAHIDSFPCSIEYRLVDLKGSVIWVRHTVLEAVPGSDRALVRGFVQDIHTEKELELESLRVSEREQNRIGQDLHDDLCQVLAGLSCLMRVIEGRIALKMPEEVPALAEINQQIIDAMHRTRALTHGLFPGKIQIADIRNALLELASQVRTRFQVEIATEFSGRFPQHSSTQIIQIYRLAQEAMSNAIKHGRATRIEIRLEAKKPTMFLTITDNGSGLGKVEPSETGVGMHIMQYRTRTLGGELTIGNGRGSGAVVSLSYPFQS
jgi:signal transduction histidine kinase